MTVPATADDAISRLAAQLDAVKRQKPKNAAEGRARAAELVRLTQIAVDAERTMADANAQKLIANSNGYANGHHVVATGLSDELIVALANGMAPIVKGLTTRLDEVESAVRKLVESAARQQDE